MSPRSVPVVRLLIIPYKDKSKKRENEREKTEEKCRKERNANKQM